MATRRVAVIGAGMAGLIAARSLSAADLDVVVLDKGRGVGGRLATRRIGDAVIDHGAQFLTAHSAEFAAMVSEWESAGVVVPWFKGRVGPGGTADADGHTRYRGAPAMNGIAKHLAGGLDVRLGRPITSVASTSTGWVLSFGADDDAIIVDDVLLTAPVPQSLALLEAGGVELPTSDLADLGAIGYEPCIAVLAPLTRSPGLPDPGARSPDAGAIGWIADNLVKGISRIPAVTIHATPSFSSARWDDTDEVIGTELLAAAGLAGASPRAQVHRWRYARPTTLHPETCLVADTERPLVFAGDAFGGPKVEGAALSGRAAASALIALGDR